MIDDPPSRSTGQVPVLQRQIPYDVTPRPMPGVSPLPPDDWLVVDDAFALQMEQRVQLLSNKRADVLALDAHATAAADELLDLTVDLLRRLPERGYVVDADRVRRPDGIARRLDRADPLGTLGRLVQEDLCILQKRGSEHRLTGAILCFPASWRLDEKFMRPLSDIHRPVPSYDTPIAARVQRLFDGVQVGRPMWRFNFLPYADASLHQPRSVQSSRAQVDAATAPYLRSEKQSILRLPRTKAVIFSIHTFVIQNPGAAVLAD